jgi:hypothetical protein
MGHLPPFLLGHRVANPAVKQDGAKARRPLPLR